MAITTRDGRTQTVMAEINMVPFIDIMLVLLIIFMITAPVIQSGLEIDVPQTRLVNELTQQNLEVSIDRQQTVYLQGEPININDLGPEIIRRMPEDVTDINVYLRADQAVEYGAVVTVLERLQSSGIVGLNLVTRPIEN
jgi:biopolymer transport protein ExbD/biopolymer transport protein TolR